MHIWAGEDMEVNQMNYTRLGLVLGIIICLFSFGAVSATTIQASAVSISEVGQSMEIPVTMDTVSNGLAGYKIQVAFSSPGVATITGVTMPDWVGLKNVDATFPAESVNITAVDLSDSIKSGAGSVTMATLTVKGVSAGTTDLVITASELTDDNGDSIQFTAQQAGITVAGSGGSSEVIANTSPTAIVTEAPSEQPLAPVATTTITPLVTNSPAAVPTDSTDVVVPLATPSPVPTVIANFSAYNISGPAPMTVLFTDRSSGYPEKFFWNFGDNSSDATSVVQNPTHIFRTPGIYSVSLNASNSKYSNTTTRSNYIVAASMRTPQRGDKTSMSVFSVPEGAECYLNNVYQGITPVNISNLTPRFYQLRLHKEGYYDVVDPVIANNGNLPTFVSGYEMVPHYAEIGKLVADPPHTGAAYIVTYPEMVTAYIDDRKVGLTDVMVMNLAVGSHNLTLVKDGFANWTDTLDIRNGLGVIQSYTYEQPYFPTNRTIKYVNEFPPYNSPTSKTVEYVDMTS